MSLHVVAYLADQNPHRDRSLGITRATACLLSALLDCQDLRLSTIVSSSSYSFARTGVEEFRLPWRTDRTLLRLATDHLHPLVAARSLRADLFYYPKGFLPCLRVSRVPRVITVHDTIIQFCADHYPQHRSRLNYHYWTQQMVKSIRRADMILTVSCAAREQILGVCERYGIRPPAINVTYNASDCEALPAAGEAEKGAYVVHLASQEPHKRTLHLLQWWRELRQAGKDLPELRLIGPVPEEAKAVLAGLTGVSRLPRLAEREFLDTIRKAKALVLPSEVEGFGLPAIEAYYLGTPVCCVAGTAVDEILAAATREGRFRLEDRDSFAQALDQVLALPHSAVLRIGNDLRAKYAKRELAARVMAAFRRTLERSPQISGG